jgi:hypothetical protein
MLDREGGQDKILIFHQDAGLDVIQLDLDRRSRPPQNNPKNQVVDTVEGCLATPDFEALGGIPTGKGRISPAARRIRGPWSAGSIQALAKTAADLAPPLAAVHRKRYSCK